jgi:hypothetical protein
LGGRDRSEGAVLRLDTDTRSPRTLTEVELARIQMWRLPPPGK